MRGVALVGTGAVQSGIAKSAAGFLGLTESIKDLIRGATGIVECAIFKVDIALLPNAGPKTPKSWTSILVFETEFDHWPDITGLPVVGLIGMDILQFCRFTLDGPAETFSIEA